MKLSVSLPEEDVRLIDEFARASGLSSRSAAIHQAVQRLRYPDLEADYAAAWDEWHESGDAALWDPSVGDGLG